MRLMSVPVAEQGWWSHLRVNPEFAMRYAGTQHARDTMFGAVSHAQFVMTLLKRVQVGHITIYNKECKTALKLGYGLRIVGGWSPEHAKDPMPECLKHEKGLPAGMVGASLLNVPKEVMWAMLTGTGLWEIDLTASHQQAILERHPDMKFEQMSRHVNDTKGFRAAMATSMDSTSDACKQLLQILNYGGNPRAWMKAYGVLSLPAEIQHLRVELNAAVQKDVEDRCAHNPRPPTPDYDTIF